MKKVLSAALVILMLLLCAVPLCVSAAETTDPAYIYFVVPTEGSVAWRNFKNIYCHIWSKTGGDIYGWQEKAERCEDMGNGYWRYDMSAVNFDPDSEYSLIFSTNSGSQTYNLNVTSSCLGDIAYCDGTTNVNPVDGEKTCAVARWTNNANVHPAIETDSAGDVINIDGIDPEEAETKWGDSEGKSYELPEIASANQEDETEAESKDDSGEVNKDGINTKAATTWIIIVCAVAAAAIFTWVIILSKRNKKQ